MYTLTLLGNASTNYQPLTTLDEETLGDAISSADLLRAQGFKVRISIA